MSPPPLSGRVIVRAPRRPSRPTLLRGEGDRRVEVAVGAPALGRHVEVEGVTLVVLAGLAQHGPWHCGKSII